MFTRIRIALACALLAALLASISVFAKGGFAFITISGADLKETIRATDGELTRDFFAFADFSRTKTDKPASPGVGYEIIRYYMEASREVPFDKLHYYPGTGFVYYDGIENGSTEYDGKWYTANAEIKTVFEDVLSGALASPLANKPLEQTKPDPTIQQTNSSQTMPAPQSTMPIFIAGSLAAIALLFILARRKSIVQ